MTATPREANEPKQAKNGRAKSLPVKSSQSLVVAAPSPSTDDVVKWWRAFKRFMADVDDLKTYYDGLCEDRAGQDPDGVRTVTDLEEDAEWCQKLSAKCRAGFERFDPPHNYEQDDDGDDVLKTASIAARLGVMIGSFMNTLPQSPELFGRAMVEQVADIEGLSMPALESACREIVRTEKWPDIPKVVDVVSEHVDQWRKRRRALAAAERTRLELIPILIEREQKKQKEAHEREVQQVTYQVRDAMRITQRLAKEIEAAKVALAKEIETRNAALAALVQKHFVAEQRESECMRKLRALTATEEEREAAAAAKATGAGCAELRLMPPPSACIEAKSEREHLSGRTPGD
jgi:hypothetical protein